MQGAGNDFVVIDNLDYKFGLRDLKELTPKICHRKFGVGADGLLVLDKPQIDGLDYTMIYRNADGSDAGMCGNGARCLALFAHQSGFGDSLKFNVHENIYRAHVYSDSEVEVTFPVKSKVEKIVLGGQTLYQIHTGTEHIVKLEEESALEDEAKLRKEGRYLRRHERFQPMGTNVNFIFGIDSNRLMVQTYERGVEDLTLACGTGAIASALVWHHINGDNDHSKKYNVRAKGGNLSVEFFYDPSTDTYSDIKLKGKAHFVFEGNYYM